MKTISAIWLIVSLFVLPCILNLEMMGCILFVALNIGGSFYTFKKYNPEFVL